MTKDYKNDRLHLHTYTYESKDRQRENGKDPRRNEIKSSCNM